MRILTSSLALALMCASAQAADKMLQANKLLEIAFQCPINPFFDKDCKPDGSGCRLNGMLTHKIDYEYAGTTSKLSVKTKMESKHRLQKGITDVKSTETFDVSYADLDSSNMTTMPSQVTGRTMLRLSCRNNKECVSQTSTMYRELPARANHVSFPLCNKSAIDDATLALEILIKGNQK